MKEMYDGSTPATISATPKPAADPSSNLSRTFGRRAASSAPESEPIASAEASRPNSPAPLPNSSVAIRAEVIWKFMPKVPAKKTTTRISSIFGCPAT